MDAPNASQQPQSLTSPSVTVSAPIINPTFNSVIAQGLVNFMKTTPPSLPMCTKSDTSSSNPVPIISSIEMDTLIQEFSDPHIGGAILEHADLKSSVQSPPRDVCMVLCMIIYLQFKFLACLCYTFTLHCFITGV